MQKLWEEFYKGHDYFHLEPHESLPSLVNKGEQLGLSTLLDLGCGPGNNLLFMAEKGFKVTGVDFSPSAASNAEDLLQSKGYEGKVYVDNLFDRITTFNQGEFEIITAINSLEYTDEHTFISTIQEIADMLTNGGILLLVIASKEAPIRLDVPEQLFFSYEEISPIVNKYFDTLDYLVDKNKSLTFMLQKKNGNSNNS